MVASECLTSLLGAELDGVADRTLVASVGHHHEHAVEGVGHQVAQDARGLSRHSVEPSNAPLLTHPQTWQQAGLTPEVHLGGGPQGSRERGKKEGSSGGGSVQGRKGEGGRGEEEGRGLGGRQGRGLGGRQGRRRKRSGAGDEGSRGGGGEQGSMCVRDGVC